MEGPEKRMKEMTLIVFGTSSESINENINYLGMSPCP